jgi:hypothetical protein
VLHDVDCMERLLLMLSVNVTAMYRDPTFFRAFREQVVPLLRSHPFVRIWHAGCSHRRGGLLDGHPAGGGGALRPLRACTPRT